MDFNLNKMEIEDLEEQVREFLDRCDGIKGKLNEKRNSKVFVTGFY